jgi:23S rRNA (cytidine2498-2'-O)-methyltransferase
MSEFEGAASAFVVTTPAGLEGRARAELRRLLGDVRAPSLLLKGNLLLLTDRPEAEVIEILRGAETICVGRVAPVQARVHIDRRLESLEAVVTAVARLGGLSPGEKFVVRCERRGQHDFTGREAEKRIALALEKATGAVGEYLGEVPKRVSVEIFQDLALVGVAPPDQVLHKEIRESRKYAPGARPLNRAQHKLREAIATFEIALPPEGRALDVGAAPGGWSAVLADHMAEVVAVDPAHLDPTVTGRPNVTHLRMRAEGLAGRTDWREHFDVITCDANLSPAEAARLLVALAPLVKPGAPALLTIKYVTSARRRHEQEAQEILAAAYEDIRIRRLPHNALETTAAMRRK